VLAGCVEIVLSADDQRPPRPMLIARLSVAARSGRFGPTEEKNAIRTSKPDLET